MSFILDALRKSDQQRQRSVTPTLTTAQAPAAESRPTALWWYGVLAAVLVGVGILIGWLHQSPPEPAAMQPAINRPLYPDAQKLIPAPLAVLPEAPRKTQPPSRESTALAQAALPPSGITAPRDIKPELASQQPASPKEAPAAVVKDERARPAPVDAAKDPGVSVTALMELPPALQQELPKLAILAHSYSSKPKSRFVYINDQMWHEEEYPSPGLKLEQITPDGMIFSYKGYRFRRGAHP